MTDVFISYSRRDKEFVQTLHKALLASKYETWIDWEDIAPTTDWWREIETGIEAAHTFIFVISKDSIDSKYCRREIDYALAQGKRLIPVLRRKDYEHNDMHPKLGQHQWLLFREEDDFDKAFATLVETINTDLDHKKTHTRLQMRALEWDQHTRDNSFLLRGKDLEAAGQWLIQASAGKEPSPTDLQREYLSASAAGRLADNNRQKMVMGLLASLLAVATGAGVIAFHQFNKTKTALAAQEKATALAEQSQREAETAQKKEAEQRKIAQKKEKEAQLSARQAREAQMLAEVAKEAESEQRQAAERAFARAEAGEAEAKRQKIEAEKQKVKADIQAELALSEKSKAEAATRLAQQEQFNSELLNLEDRMDAGFHFETMVEAVDRLQKADLQRNWFKALSILREAVYQPGYKERHSLDVSSNMVQFSPDGRTIVAATNVLATNNFAPNVSEAGSTPTTTGILEFWDYQKNKSWEFYVPGGIYKFAYSPDPNKIATISQDSGIVKIWNLSMIDKTAKALINETGELLPGEVYKGVNQDFGFYQVHQFVGKASRNVTINLKSDDFDTYLFLKDPQGNVIAEADGDYGPGNATITYPLAEDGTYTVVVSSYSFGETGSYQLKAFFLDDPELEIAESAGTNILKYAFDDPSIMVTGDKDGTIKFWNLEHFEKPVRTINGHFSGVEDLNLSPTNFSKLVSSSFDGSILVWNLNTLEKEEESLVFEDALVNDSETYLNTGSFYETFAFQGTAGQSIRINLDSQEFDPYLILRSPAGDILDENDDSNYSTNSSIGIQLPEDGEYSVVASSFGPASTGAFTLKILLQLDDADISISGHIGPVTNVKFFPGDDNKLISSGDDGSINVWNLAAPYDAKSPLQIWRDELVESAFHPKRDAFYKEHSFQGQAGERFRIDLSSPQFDTYLIVETPTGKILTENDDSRNTRHSSVMVNLPESGEYKIIATSYGNGETGSYNLSISAADSPEMSLIDYGEPVNSLSINPQKMQIVSASDDGSIRIWNLIQGRGIDFLKGHSGSVMDASFDSTGEYLVSGGPDAVKVWEQSSPLFEGKADANTWFGEDCSAQYNPVLRSSVLILEKPTGNEVVLEGHSGQVNGYSFAYDCQIIATGSSDNTVKLWDVATGKELQTLTGHVSDVQGVAFSPDNKTLVSFGKDGKIFWDFDPDSLKAKTCDWLSYYLASSDLPEEDQDVKALCAEQVSLSSNQLPLSSYPTVPERVNWVANVRGFWRGVFGEG